MVYEIHQCLFHGISGACSVTVKTVYFSIIYVLLRISLFLYLVMFLVLEDEKCYSNLIKLRDHSNAAF